MREKGGAFEAFLSRGFATGGSRSTKPSKGKKGSKMAYTEGKLKGLTQDQAKYKMRDMWKNLSPEVKAKYESESKGSDIRTDSEKAAAKAELGSSSITQRPNMSPSMSPNRHRKGSNVRRGFTDVSKSTNGSSSNQGLNVGGSKKTPMQSSDSPAPATPRVVDQKPMVSSQSNNIASGIMRKGGELVGKASKAFSGGVDAVKNALNPPQASYAGDTRKYLDPSQPAPEGYTLVGAKGGKNTYEKGAGITAANSKAAEMTRKNYAAVKPTTEQVQQQTGDPLSRPGVRDTNRKIQQGLMPKSVSRADQKKWQGNLSNQRDEYDNNANGLSARPKAFNKQSESVREGKIDDYLAKRGHNVSRWSALQRPQRASGETVMGR